MKSVSIIEINLDQVKEGLRLWIHARRLDSLFDAVDNAIEHNEARFQLVEGCFYDYKISDPEIVLGDVGENIIQQHKLSTNTGTIAPNIFVGTLEIPIIKKESGEELKKIQLEVQSVKSGYRDDYRDMLELITGKCTDLLLQANSPVSHHFEINHNQDSQTLYQRFAFIKSVIGTDEFAEAVHRITTMPVTKWTETTESRDIRNARRFSNANIKEIIKSGNRTKLPDNHFLKGFDIETLPDRITSVRKTDSVDTPENRFVKHALETFLKFCMDINKAAAENGHGRLQNESEKLLHELESQLHHTVFKDISRPTTLNLNSPVLQRKEGYREVLRVWLMFDLAAKLIWKGGDDVYGAGKKDIATLYEYWLFFKLLDLFQEIFDLEPKDISDLIQPTTDGLSLQIKQGKSTPLSGIYNTGSRKLNIRFNYNRSFSGNKRYPDSGSWTTTLRPDYTLSVWPFGVTEKEAEKQELIVHVHFDAKYKIANLIDFLPHSVKKTDYGELTEFQIEGFCWSDISNILKENGFAKIDNKGKLRLMSFFWEEVNSLDGFSEQQFDDLVENILQIILSEEKTENRKGIYKNADLLKMHAYKDAIRRTGGAYVLYPGDKPIKQKGFHEIIPGLGAFPVSPSKKDDGISDLKDFILEIIDHFINRASQREKTAFRTYDVYKTEPDSDNEVRDSLPETYGANRDLIPDDTFILIGFYNSPEQYRWIRKNKLYNFRMGSAIGSLILDKETVSSKYLLLHTKGDINSGDLWKIVSKGPRVFSKKDMIRKKYPKVESEMEDNYLIFNVEAVTDPEFKNVKWDFRKLRNYKKGNASAFPFATSLTELMKTKVN